MKYPCLSDYDSVYDGIDLEIHIVDHCNLNCAGCNHFCSLAEPFYISLDDFTNQLKLVKEKLPSLKWLMLLGGEPTLHPQLLELCQIARNLFPDIIIEILTNGKDLSKVVAQKKEFQKLNIQFTIARYNIQYNEEHIKTVCEIGASSFSWGRESFNQTLVDITGSQDKEKNFYKQCHHQLPCFTLQDYKIFECPFAAHIRHFNKKFHTNIPLIENIDYLNLYNITLDQLENFAYTSKNICKYCKPGNSWIWHLSDNSFNEYTKTMLELYFVDYPKYEQIKLLSSNTMNNNVLKSTDPNFGLTIAADNQIRFHGKMDIIIPYYILTSDQLDRLFNSLIQQTIIKDCMIYFISDNSPNERNIIYQFSQMKNLHVTFLKNEKRSGPGKARNKGIECSSNQYMIFLDSDDYLFDPYSLEQIYNLFLQSNYDIITINRQTSTYQKLKQVDYACSREFLNKYHIRFGNYFIHEDLFFTYQLELYWANVCNSAFNGVIYNQNNVFNISSSTSSEEKILSKYFTLYKICQLSENNNVNIQIVEKYLNFFANINNIEKETSIKINDPELIENIYYILFKSLNLIQSKINIDQLDILLKQFLKNQIKIEGSIVTDFNSLKQKVNKNFKKYYNNIYLQSIIIELEGE